MLNVMVRNRLTYSFQTLNINQQQQQRIRSSYTSMLRKMIRGPALREHLTRMMNRAIIMYCQTAIFSKSATQKTSWNM